MTADALTAPTWFIDSDSSEVGAFVVSALADAEIKISAAVVKYAKDARGGRINPQSLSKNPDPSLFLPKPAEVISLIAIRSDPAGYLRSLRRPVVAV